MKVLKPVVTVLLAAVALMLLFILVVLLWKQQKPLYPVSTLSDVANAASLNALLESELPNIGTTRQDVDAFISRNHLSMCGSSDSVTRCWTKAPEEFLNTGDLLRDFGNYLVLHRGYEIEFEFQGDLLANINVSAISMGP